MIPIYKPYFTKKSLSYVHDAIDSTWISSYGKYLPMAEEALKEITKSEYVILTNNGTSATHLVAKALKYKYPKVYHLLVPSNVYIAAWNMFYTDPIYNLIPIDSDSNTWNFNYRDPKFSEEIGKKGETIGILVVHNIGNIVNVPEIKKLFPNTPIVEDNCEGFLGEYNGSPSGTESLAYSISFFGNKTITSGEGGAFCTNDEEIYSEMNRIRAHGITSRKFIFDGIGFNYRMTNLQAAILYGQLEILEEIRSRKRGISELYKKNLKSDSIKFMVSEEGTSPANWMFGIKLEDLSEDQMMKLQLHLHFNNIETRPMFPPINYHGHFHFYGDNFPISKMLYDKVIILPSYPELTETEIKYISKTIKDFLKK